MMNYLISAYSLNPYHGSEDGVGWNWVLQYEKNHKKGDRIVLLTKSFNEKDAQKGMEEFGIKHVELVITDVPMVLNWFREKHSMFHHMYYILWQHWAWIWVKKSGIRFDVIHHVTMGDYRIPGEMYKAKNARTIFGPVGGAQVTPKNLKVYEKNKIVSLMREMVNLSCGINPFYKRKIRAFTDVIPSNVETYQQIAEIRGVNPTRQMVEIGIAEEYRNIDIRTKKQGEKIRILYVGRIIEKKGIEFLADIAEMLKKELDYTLEICGIGNMTERLFGLISEKDLKKFVAVRGEVLRDEIKNKYMQSDIFVMPSLRETGGTVLIEAMAYGLPIVAFHTSFCTELAKRECGIFIDTKQPLDKIKKDFCTALIRLTEDREYAKALGMNGYRYANQELTWEKKYQCILGNMK